MDPNDEQTFPDNGFRELMRMSAFSRQLVLLAFQHMPSNGFTPEGFAGQKAILSELVRVLRSLEFHEDIELLHQALTKKSQAPTC